MNRSRIGDGSSRPVEVHECAQFQQSISFPLNAPIQINLTVAESTTHMLGPRDPSATGERGSNV